MVDFNGNGTTKITTYSMWNLFRNCRKACELRYIRGMVPLQRDTALSFGSMIHECLQIWHGGYNLDLALERIDRLTANRTSNDDEKQAWHLGRAMMKGYAATYPNDTFEVVGLERTFEGKIINPETNATSRSFTLAGKIDGLVKIGNQYWLLEHKTASALDSSYLEKLWCDFQIILYSHYVEQVFQIPITGIIYNVLVKARLQQGKGETEEEFEARRDELLAKSKTGKTTATRKLPESDEDFQARLIEKYMTDPNMFYRDEILISRSQYPELQAELWELTQTFLDAKRRDAWYKNTSYCFNWNRPCPYFAFCRSGENPLVAENLYEIKPPHEELLDNGNGDTNVVIAGAAPPVF